MTNTEYRINSRSKCKGNYGRFILVLIINALVTSCCGIITYYSYVIGTLMGFMTSACLAFGIVYCIIKNYNGERFGVKTLFDGFNDFMMNCCVYILVQLLVTIGTFCFIIPGIIISIMYSMSMFIHIDHPEYSAIECLKKSKEMMYGHKMEYFKLTFSYIGWILLGIVTCGIYFLWLIPEMYTTQYTFYLNLKEQPEVVDPKNEY